MAITQARSGSSRLPEKVLLEVMGKTLLEIHITRACWAKRVDELIVATTTRDADSRIEYLAKKMNVGCYRGREADVLDRYYKAAKKSMADIIVRITSDCPLIDPVVIDNAINLYRKKQVDYVSNTMNPTFPNGIDVEVFGFQCLERAWKEAKLKSDREHVTPYIWKNSSYKKGEKFTSCSFESEENNADYRLTVDRHEDFKLIKVLIENQGMDKSWKDYVHYLDVNPHIRKINARFERDEGYKKSLRED